jgi:putative addiction module CopG family antidote
MMVFEEFSMPLTLAPEIKQYIDRQIASGAYRDEGELLTEAIRALRQREERGERRAALIDDLEQGIQSLDKGLGKPTSAKQILAGTIRG